MAFTYERDDLRRRVVVTFQGPFQTSEALEVLGRHHTEGIWTYGALYDLRGMTGQPNNGDLRRLMSEQEGASGGNRGPVAFIATDPTLYNKACAYKVLGQGDFSIEVFRDRSEAELWLATNTA